MTTLKERIAELQKLATNAINNQQPDWERGFDFARKRTAGEAIEIITKQREVIEIMKEALEKLDLSDEQLALFERVRPCLLCGQDVGKTVQHAREALEKSNQIYLSNDPRRKTKTTTQSRGANPRGVRRAFERY